MLKSMPKKGRQDLRDRNGRGTLRQAAPATSGIVLSGTCYVLSCTPWVGTGKPVCDGKQGRSTCILQL